MTRFDGRAVVCLGALLAFMPALGFSQQLVAADASAILAQASSALTGGVPVSSAIETGTVAYTAGSDDENGPVELETSGYFDSKLLMHLNNGDKLEILHQDAGVWAGSDAVRRPLAMHNALTSAPWFFPALLVNGWITDKSFSVSSLGTEERNGVTVQHLRCLRVLPGQIDATTMGLIQKASAMDLFLDSTTLLPLALEFNAHPDNNELQDIPVRIEYGDYRALGSGKAPYHIQKYLQGTLLLDIVVSDVNLNAAIPPTEFNLQ